MRQTAINEERLRLLLYVAHKYYIEKKTKTEISFDIRRSATEVARLLEEARDLKLVRVEMSPPGLSSLELKLIEKLGLKRAIVIPTVSTDLPLQRRLLGSAAAEYFDNHVKDEASVALAGGSMLYEMVRSLPERARKIKIFPAALIGRGPTVVTIDPTVLCTLLWLKSRSSAFGPASAFQTSVLPPEPDPTARNEEERARSLCKDSARLLERSKVREVFSAMQEVDFVFLSMGLLNPPLDYQNVSPRSTIRMLEELGISERWLVQQGAIADMAYCCFDADGVVRDDWRFFLTVDYKAIAAQPSKEVVLLTGYHNTARQTLAALKGRLFNVLITDEQTASAMLQTAGAN